MTDLHEKAIKKYQKACLALSDQDDDIQEWLTQVARLKHEKDEFIKKNKAQIAALKRDREEYCKVLDDTITELYGKMKQRIWCEYKNRPDIKPLYDEMLAFKLSPEIECLFNHAMAELKKLKKAGKVTPAERTAAEARAIAAADEEMRSRMAGVSGDSPD